LNVLHSLLRKNGNPPTLLYATSTGEHKQLFSAPVGPDRSSRIDVDALFKVHLRDPLVEEIITIALAVHRPFQSAPQYHRASYTGFVDRLAYHQAEFHLMQAQYNIHTVLSERLATPRKGGDSY